MITYKKGNLLEDSSDALVNTVNTVGVMGKGIALQFKQAFPDVFREYERECNKGKIHVGQMHVVSTNALIGPKYVINFATKKHWKENSKIAYIKDGLEALLKVTRKLEINSIAIPPLGCGYGGLKWADVKPLIQKTFENESIEVNVYLPAGSPLSDQIRIRTTKPNMTKAEHYY
ncbi:type II toxin-antitoxin system antitoxin DNA ADP-ribosyl glycohydrolase DarG [Virgibacillus natechei]